MAYPTRGGTRSSMPQQSPAIPALPGYQQYAQSPAYRPQYQQHPQQPVQPLQRPPRTSYNYTQPPRAAASPTPYAHAAPSQRPAPVAVYNHPFTHAPGPLPFFTPPPGQKTTDPSLSTAPTSQALYTTYSSRLRTGVTNLVQPEHTTGSSKDREAFLADIERQISSDVVDGKGSGASTPRYDSPAPFSSRRGAASYGGSSRRARTVNYAENISDDDDFESPSDGEGSDEDVEYGSRRRRTTGRRDYARDSQSTMGGQDVMQSQKVYKLRRRAEEMENGWTWLGDRTPGDRVRSQTAALTKHIYHTEERLAQEAERPEHLLPITIDFDVNAAGDTPGFRVHDRFLWNLNEPFITPHQFGVIFCEDLSIPVTPYANTISDLIKSTIEESQNVAGIDVGDQDVGEDDVVWEEEKAEEEKAAEEQVAKDQIAEEKQDGVEGDEEEQEEQEEEEPEESIDKKSRARARKRRRVVEEKDDRVWPEADCRVILNLEVQITTHVLRDRIEWDLSSPLPPSLFAKQYCTDLGLSGEAIPVVAHALYAEVLKHKKDALDLELFAHTHPSEQAKWEPVKGAQGTRVNWRSGAKRLVGVWRDWWEREEYGPVLVEMTTEEMVKRDEARMKDARRIWRSANKDGRRAGRR
ncbi:hypothetical protein B9479_003517 [Cryptococcus floricola]|uniref:Chromatin structure-remodeling complex subunit SFH1 n=1 Tax=Cryptococcus floricola TaxID=2591691 RepID=A0A5D3AZN9_9TREE|nr:hypothetical protein B9479_003517 [Cryptococcus floricola]